MPAYKEKDKKNRWIAKFSYKDWKGNTKFATKRGFATKHEAQEYESSFKLRTAGTMDMSFSDFYEVYRDNHFPRIRKSTAIMKSSIIEEKLIPYFGGMKMRDISAMDIVRWQNELLQYTDPKTGKLYKKSYLKTVNAQLSAMFNYAVRFYKLPDNPARIAGCIGGEHDIKISFWTLEEYKAFSEAIMDKPQYFYAFEVLYWTGMREGELLALTKTDIDFKKNTIDINKTFQMINGKETIGPTKTRKGTRIVKIPDSLCEELMDYLDLKPDMNDNDRIFKLTKYGLYKEIKRGSKIAGVKRIRVHDLRHSHISLLIHMGYSAVAIAERVGHESIYITFKYAHIFPEIQTDMSNNLNTLMEEQKDGEQ